MEKSSSCTFSLEIKVISAEGLRLHQRQPVKKSAFATVGTDSASLQKTTVDKEGGSHPTWNQTFVVDMHNHSRYVKVEVRCRASSGDKLVGTARIPVSDFMGGYVPQNYLHFLSYRLRDAKGEKNGIVNLSVRVKVPPSLSAATAAAGGGGNGGYHLGGRCSPVPLAKHVSSSSWGVVTGIPVWCKQLQV